MLSIYGGKLTMKELLNRIDNHTMISSIILNGGLSIIYYVVLFYSTLDNDIIIYVISRTFQILSVVINFIIMFKVDTYKEYFKKLFKNLIGIVLSGIIVYVISVGILSMEDTSDYSASNWGAMGILLIGIIYYMLSGLVCSAIIRLIVKVIQDIFKKRKEF